MLACGEANQVAYKFAGEWDLIKIDFYSLMMIPFDVHPLVYADMCGFLFLRM